MNRDERGPTVDLTVEPCVRPRRCVIECKMHFLCPQTFPSLRSEGSFTCLTVTVWVPILTTKLFSSYVHTCAAYRQPLRVDETHSVCTRNPLQTPDTPQTTASMTSPPHPCRVHSGHIRVEKKPELLSTGRKPRATQGRAEDPACVPSV